MWNGGHSSQAAWLNARLKQAESDYDFSQLNESASVTMDRSGLVAVFTPEHASEHADGANRGTMRAPNMRKRESLTRFQVPASPAAPTTTHGGYPTPGAVPIPTTAKPLTMLQSALGVDIAEGYKISPDVIDKKDLEYLNFFLEHIDNVRMRELWRLKSDKSGRKFVVKMIEEMQKSGSSLTAEETLDTRMRQILVGGMQDASFTSYLDVVGAYEELNEVRACPIPERQRAFAYKKLICDLSADINIKMLLRLSIIESAAAAIGNHPARDTPIEHVNEAAGIVLDDEQNDQLTKSIESGRAFVAGNFDPARNQRNPGGQARPPGGQTWSYNGPEEHLDGMRNCVFCDKPHVDLKCPTATKAQKDALIKERGEKAKSKRDAWRERSKKSKSKTAGTAALARTSPPVTEMADDADEAAAKALFTSGSPILVDLDDLMNNQAAGRSFMAKPSPLAAPAPSHSRASQAASSKAASEVDEPIWVVAPVGDTLPDSISVGVYAGDWKSQVVPEIVRLYHLDQLSLDKSTLKARTTKVHSLAEALEKCKALDVEPVFLGPNPIEGLAIAVGDDLAEYMGESETMSEPSTEHDEDEEEPTGTTSEDDDPESEEDTPSQIKLDKLAARVESYTVNTHVDVLRRCIKEEQLQLNGAPISPGTGGAVARRTKFEMLQDIRRSVGAPPLPQSALIDKRKTPDVPMGEPIDEPRACSVVAKSDLPLNVSLIRDTGKYEVFIDEGGDTYAVEKVGKNAAKKAARKAAAVRNLDFASPEARPPRPRTGYATLPSPSCSVVLFAVVQLLVIAFSFAPGGLRCHTISPTWVCDSLGIDGGSTNHGTSPMPTVAPTQPPHDLISTAEPGAHASSYEPQGLLHGGVGSRSLYLPALVCLFLLLKSLLATAYFVTARTPRIPWSRQANGHGKGGHLHQPPRDTSSSTMRSLKKLNRANPSKRVTSSSRFISTLGEAPVWLSLLLLAHEVATRIIPFLTAVWFATAVMSTGRCAYDALHALFHSTVFTPARVVLRVAANIVAAGVYLVYHVLFTTFITLVSEGASASKSRLTRRITVVRVVARALVHSTYADLSRLGGALYDSVFIQIPTETDPSEVDYTMNESADPLSIAVARPAKRPPRALHAFNSKLGTKRRNQLETRRALLGAAAITSTTLATGRMVESWASMICWTVIDSGCSWHCHPHFADLINTRPCSDTMSGIDGKAQRVKCIGDLPALARDHNGTWRRIIIRNVRCVPTFTDTLLSVDQFWEDSNVDCVFNSARCIHVPSEGTEPSLDLPFTRKDHLYKMAIVPTQRNTDLVKAPPLSATQRALKATIHRSKSTSFFNALPPDEQLEMLHRRLHVGYNLIRRLSYTSADIPESIKKGKAHDCEHCKIANATHVPHTGKAYQRSHVGRLIHADIAGPFKRSHHGFFYFIVLVDDHSRFKQVYFLKHKSEALKRIRSFVAKLNALSSVGKPEPVRIIGQLHMDNAGEFLSHAFTEFIDSESIDRTTCPPHVHQLNGVAERSIRSIMEIVRATREASHCPVIFWPHLVEHAVDVLNRTTGPPYDGDKNGSPGDYGNDTHHEMCSYTHVTGEAPKILTILPVGCRTYAVKPQGAFTKSGFESRGWSGMNLGRSSTIPGAYNVWLPEQHKVIQTSEVYFDESLYPWRPAGDQRIGTPSPTAAPPVDPHDVSAGGASAATEDAPTVPQQASTLPEAFAGATREASTRSYHSIKILLLFSGAYNRPDGLAQFARRLGLEVDLFDSDPNTGGGDVGGHHQRQSIQHPSRTCSTR